MTKKEQTWKEIVREEKKKLKMKISPIEKNDGENHSGRLLTKLDRQGGTSSNVSNPAIRPCLVKCAYCGNDIHIDLLTGIRKGQGGKEKFYCDQLKCLEFLANILPLTTSGK